MGDSCGVRRRLASTSVRGWSGAEAHAVADGRAGGEGSWDSCGVRRRLAPTAVRGWTGAEARAVAGGSAEGGRCHGGQLRRAAEACAEGCARLQLRGGMAPTAVRGWTGTEARAVVGGSAEEGRGHGGQLWGAAEARVEGCARLEWR